MVSRESAVPATGQSPAEGSYASGVRMPATDTPGVTGTGTTRDRILRTARDLFADRGYQRTSLQQIADRLRLTKAAILYHFPSKEHLVEALVEPLLTGLEQAVERAGTHPPQTARWVMLEAWVDTMLAHRRSLGMLFHDVSMLTRRGRYPRLLSLAMRAYATVAGPDATLAEQVRAVQAVATLGDPVVFFDDVPAQRLRAEMLAGVRRLLGEEIPERPSAPSAPSASPSDVGTDCPRPVAGAPRPPGMPTATTPGRRQAGRPRAMDATRVGLARSMLASGTHSVDEIAALLGVSRATVYRHLRRDREESQNNEL